MSDGKLKVKFGVLAFVDLLGFSTTVGNIKTVQQLARVEKSVTLVQRQFEVRSCDSDTREEHKVVGKKVRAFSDCLIVTIPLRSQLADEDGYFDLLMQEIDSVGLAQGTCVCNGTFFRGGIDLDFWYERKDVFISPALVNAAKIEKEVCVPMVALSDRLYDHLSQHNDRYFYAERIDPIARLVRQFETGKAKRKWWLVDYFRICLENLTDYPRNREELHKFQNGTPDERAKLSAKIGKANFFGWIRRHRDAVTKGLAKASTDDVRSKYLWLAKYHNGAVRRCVREPAASLFIQTGKRVRYANGSSPVKRPSRDKKKRVV